MAGGAGAEAVAGILGEARGKLDEAVLKFLEDVLEEYLSQGTIEGQEGDEEGLTSFCQPFVEEHIDPEAFRLRLRRVRGKENRPLDNQLLPAPELPIERCLRPQAPAESPLRKTLPSSRSSPPLSMRVPQAERREGGRGSRTEQTGAWDRAFSTVRELVHALSASACSSAEEQTVLEYVSTILIDGVRDDDQEEDMQEVISSLLPDLAATLDEEQGWGRLFGKVRAILDQNSGDLHSAKEQHQRRVAPSSASAPAEPVEHKEQELASDDEDWEHVASDELKSMHEIFPSSKRTELEHFLATSKSMEEAIERMFEQIQLQSMAVSAEQRDQERKRFDNEYREAMRQRVLEQYDKVEEELRLEKGKPCPRPEVRKSGAIEQALERIKSNEVKQMQRFINNEVVSHKGEKFILEKRQEDPSTFVGLKIKSKGKRGPSPNFK